MPKSDSKAVNLRQKSADELDSLLLSLRKEQFNLRFQRATGQQKEVGRVKLVRRTIARIKTVATERQRSVAKS